MGSVTAGIPLDVASALARGLALGAAIETGTYRGNSALVLREHFDEVWSIELSAELHREVLTRLGDRPGLHFLQGSSATVLPELLSRLEQPVLFWLDGHWSGGPTAGQDRECPVLQELDAIDAWPHGGASAILIDDARLFFGPPPPPHDEREWPTFLEIVDRLRTRHDRYVTALDDVIIAGPPDAREALKPVFLAHHAAFAHPPWHHVWPDRLRAAGARARRALSRESRSRT